MATLRVDGQRVAVGLARTVPAAYPATETFDVASHGSMIDQDGSPVRRAVSHLADHEAIGLLSLLRRRTS